MMRMKTLPYAPPACEYEKYELYTLLAQSADLTDDGAGDSLIPGSDYTF